MDKRRVVVTGAAGRIGRTVCADAVVHLAADPDPEATWDSVLPSNIEGPYQVATAAVACDVRRLVLASSLHAVGGYPEGMSANRYQFADLSEARALGYQPVDDAWDPSD